MSAIAPAPRGKTAQISAPLAVALSTSVIAVSGTSLIYPLLPVISGDLGISDSHIGLVIAAFTLPAIFLAPLFGLYADLYGRRWLLIGGLLLFATAGAAGGTSSNFEWLLAWRALQGIGLAALSPLTIVLLSDLAPDREQELEVQGWKVALDRVAMIVLPIMGGILAVLSWRASFFLFVLIIPLAIVAYLVMPETRPGGSVDLRSYVRDVALAIRVRKVLLAFAVGFIRFFLDYGFFVYLPLFLVLRYQTSAIVSGTMLAITAIGAIVTAVSVRRLSRIGSSERLLAVAFLISAIGITLLVLVPALWVIAAGAFLIGLGNGLISPLQKSMITRNAPAELRGGVIACDRLVQQVAKSMAPALLGLLLLVAPIETAFYALIGICLAGVAIAIIADRERRSCDVASAGT